MRLPVPDTGPVAASVPPAPERRRSHWARGSTPCRAVRPGTARVENEVGRHRFAIQLWDRRQEELVEQTHDAASDRHKSGFSALTPPDDDASLPQIHVLNAKVPHFACADAGIEQQSDADAIADQVLRGDQP